MRRARILFLGFFAATVVAVAVACSSGLDTTAGGPSHPDGGGDASGFDSGPYADSGVPIVANGLVLVHAAAFPAFRVCFTGLPDVRPMPETELMPESNLPGVDVGSAVRVAPSANTLGHAFVFREATLRPAYPPGGGGPSCGTILQGQLAPQGIEVGNLPALPDGVHLLVLTGCLGAADDPSASAARCGLTWSPGSGNLALDTVDLFASPRSSDGVLPVQVVQLSRPLDALAGARGIDLAFGSFDGGTPTPIAAALKPEILAPTTPAQLPYAPSDIASFASSAFFVTLGAATTVDSGSTSTDASAEAGVLLAQSLADTQRFSAPGAVPPAFFGAGSSYVLLVLGDPDARTADGGGDDDPRRKPHIVAIPLAQPAL